VQKAVQDFVAKNELTEKADFSPNEYEDFLDNALEQINDVSPKTSYSYNNFPRPSVLWMGAIIHSLAAMGIVQIRNSLNYNDGGIAFQKYDKAPSYLNMAQYWVGMFQSGLSSLKSSVVPRSHGSGFVGISSDFAYYGRRRY
jgi:hypothetical protein